MNNFPTLNPGDVDSRLLPGFVTAFVDGDYESDPQLRAQFLSNSGESKVLNEIETQLKTCTSFCISVAFITRSGVQPLLMTLKELEQKNIPGRVLTTDYQLFTQPAAIAKLLELKNIEVRLFQSSQKEGFHTKGYLFRQADLCHVIIGSSNWTDQALCTNREWNAKIVSRQTGQFVTRLRAEFESLWNSDRTVDMSDGVAFQTYEARWKSAQKLRQQLSALSLDSEGSNEKLEPNLMQKAFVENLQQIYGTGQRKALLISATGTGKTYAAAFAIKTIAPKRVLFIVHREQILQQARRSFGRVLEKQYSYGILSGNSRQFGASCLFATVQTVSRADWLAGFKPDEFDFIIIDEVHRAAAASYQKVMGYFQPRYWLGMTASPDRPDRGDIYSLFDHNIAHEIRLQGALEENLLCPFHYYGISDLAVNGLELADKSDFLLLTRPERVEHILRNTRYYGYSGRRLKGLMFCSRVEECRALSALLNEEGLRTLALDGSSTPEQRALAVQRLTQDEQENALDYILTVDIFNEGVDLPEVNQVVMLRPTESPIVFVQQLGRGLRKAQGKEFVVIIDFIANYENNYMIPMALSGDRSYDKDNMRRFVSVERKAIPGISTVHFDEVSSKAIYKAIDSAKTDDIKTLRESYRILRNKLGKVPGIMDFETHNGVSPLKFFEKCGSYYAFLKKYAQKEREEDQIELMPAQSEALLNYCCEKFGTAQRMDEIWLLAEALRGKDGDLKSRLNNRLNALHGVPQGAAALQARALHLQNVFLNLSNQFSTTAQPPAQTAGCALLQLNGAGEWQRSALFAAAIDTDPVFCRHLSDFLSFAWNRWEKCFSNTYADTDLVLCEKYTYADVCRILNWPRNLSGQNIGGYFYDKATKTLPVFINYEKAHDAIAYEDRFTSPQDLIALSKTKRSPESPDADHMFKRTPQDKDNRIYLFVRRNKKDATAKSFYFLGEMTAQGEPVPVTLQSGERAFETHYHLSEPVRQDIYDYLAADISIGNGE